MTAEVISKATTNMVSNVIPVDAKAQGEWTIHVRVSGDPTSLSITPKFGLYKDQLEDLTDPYALDSNEISQGYAIWSVSGKPADFVAVQISNLVGGTSPEVSVAIKAV